jgi:opacity protein-like surface antigen
MALSTWAANGVLDALFNNTAFVVAQPYASLHTGDPGLTGLNELALSGYIRKAATFGAPTAGATDNTGAVTFGPAGENWTATPDTGLFDAESTGHFIVGGLLANSRTILSGEYGEFAIGAYDFALGTQFSSTTITAIVNALLRNTSLQNAAVFASLHSADPGTDGSNELPSSYAYARWALSFAAAASRACANDVVADSPTATGTNWTAATHLGLWTAGSAGTFLWGKALTTPRTVQVGKFFRIAIGGVNVTLSA